MNPCGSTEPTNETGYIWSLSQHRLVCTDLTDLDTAMQAFKGEQPKVIIESDPAKCDAIIELWQKLTGYSATMHGYNHLYDQVKRFHAGNSALSCGQLSRKDKKKRGEDQAQAGRSHSPHRQNRSCC